MGVASHSVSLCVDLVQVLAREGGDTWEASRDAGIGACGKGLHREEGPHQRRKGTWPCPQGMCG